MSVEIVRQRQVLLTVEEAAKALAVSRTMVFQLIRTGQLVTVRIGRLRRVPTWALEDFARGDPQ
jgi:excisionase family DNA binding protein